MIKLEFSNEQCDKLLSKMGYQSEDTTLYYRIDDPYGKQSEFEGLKHKVAYKGEKPKELCSDYPLLEDCKKYLYANVCEEVLSDCFFRLLLHNVDLL